MLNYPSKHNTQNSSLTVVGFKVDPVDDRPGEAQGVEALQHLLKGVLGLELRSAVVGEPGKY